MGKLYDLNVSPAVQLYILFITRIHIYFYNFKNENKNKTHVKNRPY